MTQLWFDTFYASDYYAVTLTHPVHGVHLAYMTSDMQINTDANWSTMTDQPLDSLSKFPAAMGKTMLIDQITYQSYQGTEPLMLTFNFAYIAVRNAAIEVLAKSRNLGRWPLPINADSGVLTPPVASMKRCCDVETKYLSIIDWLLPVSCNITYSSALDKTGYPVKADVSMVFKTKKVVLVEDFMSWFKV